MALKDLFSKKHDGQSDAQIRIPSEGMKQLLKEIKGFKDPSIKFNAKGRFCYVNYNGDPLCRLGYRSSDEQWDFAIYQYSTQSYSTSNPLLPSKGTVERCIRSALHAYNLR